MHRIALLGLGDIADIHLMALNTLEDVQVVAVCDTDPALWEKVPKARGYGALEEMLGKETLDAVHVLLPHHLHAPAARTLLARGIPVFLEKPAGISLEEVRELVELEKASTAKINLCLQNRLNATTEALLTALSEGRGGKVLGYTAEVPWFRPKAYYDVKPWRGRLKEAGGGHMINQGLHTLDLLCLLGGPIAEVRGEATQLLSYGIEVEDTVSARMVFESGIGGYYTGTNANHENQSVGITVSCAEGRYVMKDCTLTYHGADGAVEFLAEDDRVPGTKFYYGAGHLKLFKAFYDALENNTPMPVPVAEAIPSMTLMEGILRSSAKKRSIRMEEI